MMRIIFMGTPAFALPTLKRIIADAHEVVGVYAQPPRPAKRGMRPQKSPVHSYAQDEADLPVFTPETLRDEEEKKRLLTLAPDVICVVAYGKLLPETILNLPKLGCLNVHASLLPRWRGAAPIQHAIMAGDEKTGVSIMRMTKGLDSGPIGPQETCPITSQTTSGDLHDPLMESGARLLSRALRSLEAGTLEFRPQDASLATHAPKIMSDDGRIDWREDCVAIHRKIRAFSPTPGAFFEFPDAGGKAPERIKVFAAEPCEGSGIPGTLLGEPLIVACGSGALALREVQRTGKKIIPADAFRNGLRTMPAKFS